MKIIELADGSAVVQMPVTITITRLDLIGVVAFAIYKGRKVRTRKQVAMAVSKLIELHGVLAVNRLGMIEKYKRHLCEAHQLVSSLFPELRNDLQKFTCPTPN